MKNTFVMAALSAAILAGTGMQGVAQGMADAMAGKGARPSFTELDADGDGKLTRAEMENHRKARFAAADTDGDGKLSRAELDARMAERQAEMREKMLDRMIGWRDVDGDGSLSAEELQRGDGMRMFSRMDRDRDGSVSAEEFEKMSARHDRRHGGKDGRMGRHGGDHGGKHRGEHRGMQDCQD